jgi:hypothetical protein
MRHHVSLDMSLSREEFFRLLPSAVGIDWMEEGDGTILGSYLGGSWTIHLVPLMARRMGRFLLPRHSVEIVLEGISEEEAQAFMARFHQAFQRGGG